jgi:hypothetical protein
LGHTHDDRVCTGGAGHGNFELLSCFWIAGVDTDFLESGVDSVFDCGGVEILQESGDIVSSRCTGGRSVAVFGTSAAASAEGHEFQVWGFVFASWDKKCGAVDDSAIIWSGVAQINLLVDTRVCDSRYLPKGA